MDVAKQSKSELIDHFHRLTYQLEETNKNDADLNNRLEELERFYKVIIHRELRAVEMKNAMMSFKLANSSAI